eukprot:Gb_09907 [translate_table: standard]
MRSSSPKDWLGKREHWKKLNMVRPPCCEKLGVKKGPWTPEEDIVLVSYIQEHGPGNWRLIPAQTGLMRCSKSCRLRWTNYLRPGIRRGNFTAHEDQIIIHLQALLDPVTSFCTAMRVCPLSAPLWNTVVTDIFRRKAKWAAIASYLPQRTDNDIKNYWNTHLKKRLKRLQSPPTSSEFSSYVPIKRSSALDHASKGQWETKLQTDIHLAKQALFEAINAGASPSTQESSITSDQLCLLRNQNSTYACSTTNLSKLLEGWKQSSVNETKLPTSSNPSMADYSSRSEGHQNQNFQYSEVPIACDMEALNSIDNGGQAWRSPCNSSQGYSIDDQGYDLNAFQVDTTNSHENSPDNKLPFSILEKWLMEENFQDQIISYGSLAL